VGVVAASSDTLKAERDDDDGDEGAAFRFLISELEEWCGFNTSAAVSARDQAAVESDSVTEAAVPGVDRHGERTEFSPRVEQEQEREQGQEQKQEQERLSAQSIGKASDVAVGRLAVLSSLDVMSEEAAVSVVDESASVSPVSSVLPESWPFVVLQIGWCPGLGGRAVVSVRQADGAGFGCLAEGMPVIRADAAGLVQEATLRVADEHVPVKEAPMVVVDAALSMVVKISERCEAVPACMESMGLLVEVIGMMLSPDVSGTVVDRYMGALALLANMAVEISVSGSDPPKMGCIVASGCDPPMLGCC
jgi:hypothetical protein